MSYLFKFSRLAALFKSRTLDRSPAESLWSLSWFKSSRGYDHVEQLRHVMDASFYKKKVMSKSEYRVFRLVETEVQARRNGCRVLSQTSLGEIIGSNDLRAYRSINSKRVDVLIIGPYGDPIAAIEYQGAAHYQGTAPARDAVKKEALRKAGIKLLEIQDDHTSAEIQMLVRRLFQSPQLSTQPPSPYQTGPWSAA